MMSLQLPRILLHILNVNIACVARVCIFGKRVENVIFVCSMLLKCVIVFGMCLLFSEDRHIRNGFVSSSSSGSGAPVSEILIYWISRGDLCICNKQISKNAYAASSLSFRSGVQHHDFWVCVCRYCTNFGVV